MRPKFLYLCALLVALPHASRTNAEPGIPATAVMPPSRAAAAAARLIGVGSCTASGCHGNGNPSEIVGSEYNIWISSDPHAEAYSVLYEEASVRMVQLLDGKDAVAPHRDQRCLACHSTTFAPPRDERAMVESDGVGCEACHGPAEHWLGPHVAGQLSIESRARLGLWNTDQLHSRAKICADCHVGGLNREVNHDMIAAGHPRLQFEMGAYLEALPKHWDENRDRSFHGKKFDAINWAVGQAITSQAALEQLQRRATLGEAWPELAEWSCSACHHDLQDNKQRQESLSRAGNLSGRSIAWDDWNHFLPRHYLRGIERTFHLETTTGSDIATEIEALQTLVQAVNSDRAAVAERAGKLATKLGYWADALEQAQPDSDGLQLLSYYIAREHTRRSHPSWSSAAQAYDALASMHQSRLEMSGGGDAELVAITQALDELYTKLAQRHRAPSKYSYDPAEINASFEKLRLVLERSLPSQ